MRFPTMAFICRPPLAASFLLSRPSFRVTITLSKIGKHTLPVEDTCAFSHGVGYHLYLQFCEEADEGIRKGDNPATAFGKVWGCMQEARCRVVDDRRQMVVFRDPRAAAVSSFYFLKAGGYIPEDLGIDAFVIGNFPIFCKWLLIRLALFARMVPKDKVSFFWYDRWQVDPRSWHRHLFQAVGLRVPESVEAAAREAALADDFPFFSKGHDSHLGSTPTPGNLTAYRGDLTEETNRGIDEMMRQWLPTRFIQQLLPA